MNWNATPWGWFVASLMVLSVAIAFFPAVLAICLALKISYSVVGITLVSILCAVAFLWLYRSVLPINFGH